MCYVNVLLNIIFTEFITKIFAKFMFINVILCATLSMAEFGDTSDKKYCYQSTMYLLN